MNALLDYMALPPEIAACVNKPPRHTPLGKRNGNIIGVVVMEFYGKVLRVDIKVPESKEPWSWSNKAYDERERYCSALRSAVDLLKLMVHNLYRKQKDTDRYEHDA